MVEFLELREKPRPFIGAQPLDDAQYVARAFPGIGFSTEDLRSAARQLVYEEMSMYLAGAWLALQYHWNASPTVAQKAGRSRNHDAGSSLGLT